MEKSLAQTGPSLSEKALIGAMMVDADGVTKVRHLIEVQHLEDSRHRVIFKTLCDLETRGRAGDLPMLADRLRETGQSEEAGGITYLMALCSDIGSLKRIEEYAANVRQEWLRRQIVVLAHTVKETPTVEAIENLLATARSEESQDVPDLFTFEKNMMEAFTSIDSYSEEKAHFKTGFDHLDNILISLRRGELMTISSRPGGGKTALMSQVAMNMAESAKRVMYFTTEMKSVEFVHRLYPGQARVTAERIRLGDIREEDYDPLMKATERMSKLEFAVVDTPRPSLGTIRRAIHNFKPDVVFLDHLHRMDLPAGDNKSDRIEEFMIGLKTLCLRTGVLGVLGVQMDRQIDRDVQKKGKAATYEPQLKDLKGSGSIEAESDQVVLLWWSRPDSEVDHHDEQRLIRVKVAKARNAPTGYTLFSLNKLFVKIEQATGSPNLPEETADRLRGKLRGQGKYARRSG